MDNESASPAKTPWNKGKIVGHKAPLKLKDIWAIRIRLQLGHRTRELALSATPELSCELPHIWQRLQRINQQNNPFCCGLSHHRNGSSHELSLK